jgi:transposase
VATERDEATRAAWRDAIAALPVEQFVFLDESHANVTFTPYGARAPRGQRAYGAAPRNYRHNTTLLAAVTAQQVQAAMTLVGPLDGDAFEAFIRHVLCPTLRPGQIVLLDNLSVHKRATIRPMLEAAGCRLVFLPAYSPDFTPIEAIFAKLKTALRRAAARTQAELVTAIADALAAVTARDLRHSFRHCGYHLPAQSL